MKKHIALYAIVAAAMIAAPVIVRAEDKTNKPAASESSSAAKKRGLPFHGKVAAVNTAAMTVTVGTMTINVTSETKITKEGKPATLSDITTGENISGSYKKDDAGKMDATVINIVGKAAAAQSETKKKKAANE